MKKELIENPRKYFEDKFIERYGEGFDFSEFVYVDNNTKCKISCPVHGEFEVCMRTLFESKRKFACTKCSNKIGDHCKLTSEDEIVDRIKQKFGDRIDLTHFKYKGVKHKYDFICTEHNEVFTKSLHALLKSDKLCKLCPKRSAHLLDTRTEYLGKVIKRQGSNFRFTLPPDIDPIPRDLKIKCWCPNCDREIMRPKRDLSVVKIKRCSYCNSGFYNNYADLETMTEEQLKVPCSLYQLKFYKDGEYQFDKVGVTRNGIVKRFVEHKNYGYVIKVVSVHNSTFGDCLKLEHEFMEKLGMDGKRYRVHDLKGTKIGGWTECFIDNDSVAELTIDEYCQNEQS